MRKIISFLFSGALLATTLVGLVATPASAATMLVTCTDLVQNKTTVLKIEKKSCNSFFLSANWHPQLTDSSDHSGSGFATLRVCSSKNPYFTYRKISAQCPKFLVTTDYWRSIAAPQTPEIVTASALGHDSAVITFTPSESSTRLDAPIAYYLVTETKSGRTTRVPPGNAGRLYISGLTSESVYAFIIAAVSVDGVSRVSKTTPAVRTSTAPTVASVSTAVVLAAPAFTISSSSETRTVNTAAAGFIISSTGGAIASFEISATPAGMSFSTSTGALSGTPTSVASATAYTITATNAAGSSTQAFVLTVAAVVYAVGAAGPGGGTIFYVATTPFVCGPTRSTTCTYLEAASSGWNTGSEPSVKWALFAYQSLAVNNASSPETATATAIGWGYRNTRAIILQGNSDTATSAAALADSYNVTVSSVVYDDWYLPSKDELNQMCKWSRGLPTTNESVCTGGVLNTGLGAAGFVDYYYWSSSEYSYDYIWVLRFDTDLDTNFHKAGGLFVRPVRAF